MKLTAKWSLTKAKRTLRKWMREVDDDQKKALADYAGILVKQAIRYTPPGKGAKGMRALKERIRRDFEGDTEKARALTDDDVQWYTDRGGHHHAYIPATDSKGNAVKLTAAPFRAIRGRVTAKKLQALNRGKYHVELADGDLHKFITARPELYRFRRNRKKQMRFTWRSIRHLATVKTIKAEIRRRQFLVGRLLAGWKPVARKARVKLPAQAEQQPGNGAVSIRKSGQHGAVLTATNSAADMVDLQRIINRNLPELRRKVKTRARKRKKELANKLQKA